MRSDLQNVLAAVRGMPLEELREELPQSEDEWGVSVKASEIVRKIRCVGDIGLGPGGEIHS